MSDIMDQLAELDQNTMRKHFKVGDLRYTSGAKHGVVSHGDDRYELNESSFKQLCELFGLPHLYASRCPNDLREYTINYWLKAQGDSQHSALITNGDVRSFMNPTYSYVPTIEVFTKMFDVIGDNYTIANSHLDEEAFEVVLFDNRHDRTVVNSPVHAGLRMLFSDSWSVFPKFDAYLCRIECLNAAFAPLSSKKFRVAGHSRQEVLDQAEEFATESVARIPDMIDGFAALVDQPVDHPLQVIRKICAENRLPKKIVDLLLETILDPVYRSTLPGGEVESMHDIVNLFTFVATHKSAHLPEIHREHLFEISGSIMLYNQTRCVSCGGSSSV